VVTIHDLIFLEKPELYKPIDRIIYERKVRYVTRAATRIIAVSEQTKQDIIRFLGVDESRISVVYQGCSRQFYKRLGRKSFAKCPQTVCLPL
jgi:glycosyltransferase involved in cell wall biosynthesis